MTDPNRLETQEEIELFISKLSRETRRMLFDELLKQKNLEIEEHNFRIKDENSDQRRFYTAKQKIDGRDVEVKYKTIHVDDINAEVQEILDFGDDELNKKYKDILDSKTQYFTWLAWMNETKKAGKKIPLYITSESQRQEADQEIERLKSQWYDHVQIVNITKLIREFWYDSFLKYNNINLCGFFHVDNVFKGIGKGANFWSAALDNKSSFGAYFVEFNPYAERDKNIRSLVSDYKWYGFSGRCIKEEK